MYRVMRARSATTRTRRRVLRVVVVVCLAGFSLLGFGMSAAGAVEPGAKIPETVTCTGSGTVYLDPPLKSLVAGGDQQEIDVTGSGKAFPCTQPGYLGSFRATWEITTATLYGSCEQLRGYGEGKITWIDGPHNGEKTTIKATGISVGVTGTAVFVVVDGPYKGNLGLPVPLVVNLTQALLGCATPAGVSEVSGTGVGALTAV